MTVGRVKDFKFSSGPITKKFAMGGANNMRQMPPQERGAGGKPAPSTLSSLEKMKSMIEKPSGGAPTGTGGPMRPPRDMGTGSGPRQPNRGGIPNNAGPQVNIQRDRGGMPSPAQVLNKPTSRQLDSGTGGAIPADLRQQITSGINKGGMAMSKGGSTTSGSRMPTSSAQVLNKPAMGGSRMPTSSAQVLNKPKGMAMKKGGTAKKC
jgi:hypothetical protein